MDDKKPQIKPLFSDSPANRSPKIITEDLNEISSQNSPKSYKDIPQSTRSSRVTRALLKLDDKERIIVKAKSQGKEDKEALELAGYSPSYANAQKKNIINKPSIQSALAIIMENTGITDEFLATKLKEGMESKKMHGSGKDSVIVDDMPTRHKYLETGLKIKGHMDKKVDIIHHKSHEDQLRELQGGDVIDADYDEILPD